MNPDNYILLGKISKVHGFNGAVSIVTEKEFTEEFKGLESVFLEIDGRQVPFFIEYLEQSRPGQFVLKFEGYDSVSRIKEFTGCRVFVRAEKGRSDNHGLSYPEGYLVYSADNKLVGSIAGIIRNPFQWIFKVKSLSGNEILIPVHEDLIIRIDDKGRKIIMIIADGLESVN